MFESKNYISNHLILDDKTGEHKLQDFRFCFIELPKFNKTENELESISDKWIFFLKNAKNLKVIPEKIQESEIKSAFDIINEFNWTKEELEMYDTISIYRQDERGRLEQATIDGIAKGKIEGRIEEKKEIAISMLKDNEPLEKIAKYTSLSIEEIKNLIILNK
jgi:predicted transposase/invertase (TIGR01784 family)